MIGRTVLRKLWSHLGRRGVSLLFVGALSLVISASIAFSGPEQVASPAYIMLSAFAPLPIWATCWAFSAGVCWVQAFMKQDRVAFAVATAMWWLYGLAFIIGLFTGVNPRGWVFGLVWIAFGGWLNLIATWPEASPLSREEKARANDP